MSTNANTSVRAIRGAITSKNTESSISENTCKLISEMIVRNAISVDNIISIYFTCTADLTAHYPAAAVRKAFGITSAALMCAQEMKVAKSLEKCIRALILVEVSGKTQAEMQHVYLEGAANLRPDLNETASSGVTATTVTKAVTENAGENLSLDISQNQTAIAKEDKDFFQIAIDGPGGSGKSTLARSVAKKLGFLYVDSGAMYRAVGLYCLRNGILTTSEAAVTSCLAKISIGLQYSHGEQRIFLNSEDVTLAIRRADCGKAASAVAVFSKVRDRLVSLQREIAGSNSIVMDGRDIGTHVLPYAELKIYLDADPGIRAKRRCEELALLNLDFDYEKMKQEIIARDFNDMSRKISPLIKAKDAVVIDSDEMDEKAVLEYVLKLVKDRGGEAH